MEERKEFFTILRDALWRTDKEQMPAELSVKAVNEVIQTAEKQTVAGLVVESLFRNNVKLPEDQFYEAMGYKLQVEQQNQQVNKVLKELVATMDKHGIKYVVVKGQVVASAYPAPALRHAGDIDFYCDKEQFAQLFDVLKSEWDIEKKYSNSDKHIDFEKNGVTVEGHFSLLSLYDNKSRLYWQKILEQDKHSEVTVNGIQVKTLSSTLHTLYIFMHLYHHLMELGVGLRQFCDLAVMLHYKKEDIDYNQLRCYIKNLGMEGAFRACGGVLVDALGLSSGDFPYELNDSDRKYGRKILDVVMYRGNMGKYNKQNGFHGWRHKLEATGIKISHTVKFLPLAPAYTCNWLFHEFGRKVLKA